MYQLVKVYKNSNPTSYGGPRVYESVGKVRVFKTKLKAKKWLKENIVPGNFMYINIQKIDTREI